MFRGNRGTGFTIVTLLFGITVFVLFCIQVFDSGGLTAIKRHKAAQNSQKYAKDAEQEIKDRCLFLEPISMAKCIVQIIEATNEHDRIEADRVAQGDMALWAFWMTIISGTTVIVTGVGVWWVKRTLDATLDAAEAARDAVLVTREIGEAQARAYLAINTKVESGLDAEFPDDPIIFEIIVKNTGSSPARFVSYTLGSDYFPNNLPVPCPDMLGANIEPESGSTIEAGMERPVRWISKFSYSTIVEDWGSEKPETPYLTGIVEYTDVFKRRQKTRFAYRIGIVFLSDNRPKKGDPVRLAVSLEAANAHNDET